jgi:hypothetical protein
MLKIATKTDRQPEEVIEAAISFFGPGALGLEMGHRSADHVAFEGGGGFVTVDAVRENGKHEVTVIAVEWEIDARRFIGQL